MNFYLVLSLSPWAPVMVSRSFLLMNCICWRKLHIIFPSQDRLLLFSLLSFNTKMWWNNILWVEVYYPGGKFTQALEVLHYIKNQEVNQLTRLRNSLKLTGYTRHQMHILQGCVTSKVCWGGRQARLWERGSDSSRWKSRDLKSSRWVFPSCHSSWGGLSVMQLPLRGPCCFKSFLLTLL